MGQVRFGGPRRAARAGFKSCSALCLVLSLILGLTLVTGAPEAEAAFPDQERMIFPVSGSVTSDFNGEPCGDPRDHRAYDVPGSLRTNILAAYAGTIRKGFDPTISGHWIAVIHRTSSGTRYETFYAHLDDSQGDPYPPDILNGTVTKVIRGQVIGYMGKTGRVIGNPGIHLHLAIKKGSPSSSGWNDPLNHALAQEFDNQIGCGKTWTAKAAMPMDFSSNLYVRMVWYVKATGSGSALCFNYGNSNDFPVMGDWDGNGVDTPGVVQGNVWNLDNGYGTAADIVFGFGVATDTFIVGDWDGDGIDTPGVVRGNVWYLKANNNPNDGTLHVAPFGYGSASDIRIAGDWDGDGDETPGVVRDVGNSKRWYLNDVADSSGADYVFNYGSKDPNPSLDLPTDDLPTAGNWDGSSAGVGNFDTSGIVRGNDWHLRNLLSGGVAHDLIIYGDNFDTPLPIDRDSWPTTEKDTQAVARASMETTGTC